MGPAASTRSGRGRRRASAARTRTSIVARNLGRSIAAGASAHSDHGRDILEVFAATARGETAGYHITDEAKLRRLAVELEIRVDGREVLDVAREVADALFEDFGSRKHEVSFIRRVPRQRRDLLDRLGITPRGIDRENVEMLHRTHMGVDNDYINLLLHGLRTSLVRRVGRVDDRHRAVRHHVRYAGAGHVDGEPGHAARATRSTSRCTVTTRCCPTSSSQAASDPELLELARQKGATGINLVGLCCTGNELLMRRGVPMAGNHLMQELVHHDRRARGDGRRLPMHHAVGHRRREVLPHRGHLDRRRRRSSPVPCTWSSTRTAATRSARRSSAGRSRRTRTATRSVSASRTSRWR